jgi:hypothetical protein
MHEVRFDSESNPLLRERELKAARRARCGKSTMSSRKEIRRAKAEAIESQSDFVRFIEYRLVPFAVVCGITLLLPDIHVSLRWIIGGALLFALYYWAPDIGTVVSVAHLPIGYGRLRILENLRDDLLDKTGQKITRSDIAELIIASVYHDDVALTSQGEPYSRKRSRFWRWVEIPYQNGWGHLIFFPEKLYGKIHHAVCLHFGDWMRPDPDSLNHGSFIRTVVEAACDSGIAEDEWRSLEELRASLMKRMKGDRG